MSCIQTAAECSVDAAISTQYPRALEWLDEVRPEMAGLTPPSNDATKVSDAVAGLDTVRAAIGGTGNLTPTIQCGWNRVLATGQTTVSLPGDDGTTQAGSLLRYKDDGGRHDHRSQHRLDVGEEDRARQHGQRR